MLLLLQDSKAEKRERMPRMPNDGGRKTNLPELRTGFMSDDSSLAIMAQKTRKKTFVNQNRFICFICVSSTVLQVPPICEEKKRFSRSMVGKEEEATIFSPSPLPIPIPTHPNSHASWFSRSKLASPSAAFGRTFIQSCRFHTHKGPY